MINRRAERIRGSGQKIPIGKFAGFKLFVSSAPIDRAELVIKGAGTYLAKISDNRLGTIRSLEYAVQSLDESAAQWGQSIKDTEKRIRDLEPKIGVPFEYADQLAMHIERQQEIVKALDLAKNQAPNQLDAKLGEEENNGAAIKEETNDTPKKRLSTGIRI